MAPTPRGPHDWKNYINNNNAHARMHTPANALNCDNLVQVGVHTPGGCTGGPLSRVLGSPGAPAFVLCRLGARKVITFVYFCPDAAPVKVCVSICRCPSLSAPVTSFLLIPRAPPRVLRLR